MKTLIELLKQEPVYLNNWSGRIGVIADFNNVYMSESDYMSKTPTYGNKEAWERDKSIISNIDREWENINILFASYGCDNYQGDAFVLFEKDGKLFEVNGSHCSCFGLEGQFNPEETTLDALKLRLIDGRLGFDDYSGNAFSNHLKEFLGISVTTNRSTGS